MSVPRHIPGFRFIRTLDGINEYLLVKNGLRVLIVPDHSVPVAACMVTYHVGSRNEVAGYTGSTHILEHLLFKGSKRFDARKGRDVWKLLETKGARINATTWLDRTNYYEVVPRERLRTAIELEADRMRHAILRAGDLASEMTVVRNEFERGENDPTEALDKHIWATAYLAHPYHHSTIGWKSDIEGATIERLREFYDTFYWPNNATVSIIGDIDVREVLGYVRKYFGAHPHSPHTISQAVVGEPEQEGPRAVTVLRPGNTRIIGIAHKTPAGLDSDIAPLAVLALVLAGGKASRFYRKLVDGGKAAKVHAMFYPFFDPGLFTLYVHPSKDVSFSEIEEVVRVEYAHIARRGITAKEIAMAREKFAMDLAESRDGTYALAATLNECLAIGDWRWFATFPEQIRKVRSIDVARVVQKYFVRKQETVGYFSSTTHD